MAAPHHAACRIIALTLYGDYILFSSEIQTIMKTPEDFKTLAGELETLSKKLAELNEEELALVAGGHRNDNAKKD